MNYFYQNVFVLFIVLLLGVSCSSTKSVSNSDSSGPDQAGMSSQAENGEIKEFSEVIKDSFEKDEGLFNVYKDDSDYYYMIPDFLLEREMLMVSRISRTASGIN